MVKLQKRVKPDKSVQFFITVPVDLVRLAGWEAGTKLAWAGVSKGEMILKEVPVEKSRKELKA